MVILIRVRMPFSAPRLESRHLLFFLAALTFNLDKCGAGCDLVYEEAPGLARDVGGGKGRSGHRLVFGSLIKYVIFQQKCLQLRLEVLVLPDDLRPCFRNLDRLCRHQDLVITAACELLESLP